MSIDVRIKPEVSTTTIAGIAVQVSSLLLGGVPRGAAVVITGPDGLNSVEAVDTMNALAQHGYESVLVDSIGPGPDDDFDRALIRHSIERLSSRGWTHEQVAVIGYGRGARAALLAASETTYGAAISIPRDLRQLVTPIRITTVQTPWLGMVGLGAGDELTAELAALRDEITASSGQHTSLVGYPGVAHCLHDSTEPLVHSASFDCWQRTAEWLNIHVEPRPTPGGEAWRERQKTMRQDHR